MAGNRAANDHGVPSPIAKLLREKQASGLSFREMERVALSRGYRLTSSSFEQIAKDSRARRLSADAIHAIAVVLGLSSSRVAELDDQRWGLARSGEPQVTDGVERAIMDDDSLSDRRKGHLIELYRELRQDGRG